MKHYLVIEWAEEPGAGTWSPNLDWHLSHPPDCPMSTVDDLPFVAYHHTCDFQWEIDNIGADAIRCFTATKPCCVPVDRYVHKTWVENGSHRGWDLDTGIVVADGDEQIEEWSE